MNILIEKDPSNLVAKSVTATEREAWAVDFTIYDVNADGSRGDAYGPTRTRQEEGPLYVDSLDAIRVGPDGDQRSTILTAQQVAAVTAKQAERQYAGATLCDWQASGGALTTTGSTGTGFAFALDTTVTLFGKPTAKCTFPSDASAQTFIGIWTPTNPIRLRDVKVIHIPILFTSNYNAGGVGNPLQVWLQTSSGKSIRIGLTFANSTTNPALGSAGVWHTYSIARGAACISGTGTMTDLDTASETITSVRIVQATTGATANTNPVWVGEIRADCKRTPGRVTICMDGEYSSQYSIIHPLLAGAGLRASLAITNSDIGTTGRMTAAQISEMYAYGHECIHHTYDASKANGYVNSADWPTALTISEDVRAQWAYFAAQGWTRGIGFGVWGFTQAFESGQTQARQQLVRDGLRNGGLVAVRRSVPYNEANKHLQCTTRMPVDPLVVAGCLQISADSTDANFIAAVDAAESTGQWAIITLHRAVVSAPGALEILSSALASGVSHLASRVAAGGVVCQPFGEVYSDIYGDRT